MFKGFSEIYYELRLTYILFYFNSLSSFLTEENGKYGKNFLFPLENRGMGRVTPSKKEQNWGITK